jgi:hypothetical protein
MLVAGNLLKLTNYCLLSLVILYRLKVPTIEKKLQNSASSAEIK